MRLIKFTLMTLLFSACNFIAETDLSALPDKRPSHFSPLECPTGYIPIYGNSSLGTLDFCVMKYVAQNSSGTAVSTPDLPAWTNINANGAWNSCQNLGVVGDGYFALISNAEWMTIARDIELVAANWSGGSTGSGVLAIGYNSNTNIQPPSTSQENTRYNLGGNTFGISGDHENRRTLFLSHGQEIWDFGGNVFQWVDWDPDGTGHTLGPIDCNTGGMVEFTTDVEANCSLEYDDFRPLTASLDSSHRVGRISAATEGGVMRGAGFNFPGAEGHGPYNISFTTPTTSNVSIGFRCVWRPF